MKWLIAYLSLIASSVLSAVLLGFLFKSLSAPVAYLCLAIGCLIGYAAFKSSSKLTLGLKKEDLNFWTIITVVIYCLISLRAFLWLIFKVNDFIKIISPNNLGDISLHISFIQYFANGVLFWPDSQIFAGEKLHYPVGIDLFNSLLLLTGIDLIQGLVWVGLLGSITTLIALFVWGRTFTIAGFIFNGGFAGLEFFSNFVLADYQSQLAWKNIFLTMFVTQRGLLYALPVGLLLLSSWREKFFPSENKSSKQIPLWIEILLYSSMPIFHVHTFIILSLLLGIWLIFLPMGNRIKILKLLGFSLIPASLLIGLIVISSNAASSIYIKWGWMQEKDNFISFWIYNFGIFWPLVIPIFIQSCGIPIKSKFITLNLNEDIKQSRFFILPAVFLFILFCNVMMAKYDWDNCKLLIWPYLILLPYLWKDLLSKLNDNFKYLACSLLFFSGFICLMGGFISPRGYDLYRHSEVVAVQQLIKELPIENRFAAFPEFNHPLLLCGRKVVLGYPGWIWTHGYNLENHSTKLKKLMMGEEGWDHIAKELGINYIFWGFREENEYKNSAKPWKTTGTKINVEDWVEIYELNN